MGKGGRSGGWGKWTNFWRKKTNWGTQKEGYKNFTGDDSSSFSFSHS